MGRRDPRPRRPPGRDRAAARRHPPAAHDRGGRRRDGSALPLARSAMTAAESRTARGGPPSVLFVQAADAASYPPIIHAASLMAEAGWRVCVLSAPVAATGLAFPRHPGIELCPI